MGSIQSFTPASIDSLSKGKRSDPLMPGLYIEVAGRGRKAWRYRRRVAKSDTIVSVQLGNFPAFTIPAAREWAAGLNEAVERGEDPRVALRAEAVRTAMIVEKAHGLYMEAMRRGDRRQLKPRSISDKEAIFTRDINPRLGSIVLDELSDDDCWDAVYDKARTSKDRANKMAGELSCFLKWSSGREGQMSGIKLVTHPAPALNSNWFDTGPKANQRFLADEELKWFFKALVDEPLVYRRGFILLLLTAARRTELFAAPATEIVDGIWTLPADRSKNGEANIVALGDWGRTLAQTNRAWLFPSPRVDGPQLSGWFKARDRIHARMEKLAGHSIASWHFHDFRRTFRSRARRLEIDRDIAELMLNHKRKGIEGVYNKSQELDLRSTGFKSWEAFLLGIARNADVARALLAPELSCEGAGEDSPAADGDRLSWKISRAEGSSVHR